MVYDLFKSYMDTWKVYLCMESSQRPNETKYLEKYFKDWNIQENLVFGMFLSIRTELFGGIWEWE